jgi:membrane associated rhomboid family serine protease
VLPLRDSVPTRTFPLVTIALIAANAGVWLLELRGTPVQEDIFRYGYYPCSVQGPCLSPPIPPGVDVLPWWESVFTSMFMHASWFHLLGNMLFLWIFGNNVEDALGRARFLVWYLAAGVAAAALQTFVTLAFATVFDASIPNVGASGAIAGVLGAYVVLFPWARVLTLFVWIVVEVPALFYLGFWFVFQAWAGGLAIVHPEPGGGGVAFFAHVGGFVFGILTVKVVARRRPLRYR